MTKTYQIPLLIAGLAVLSCSAPQQDAAAAETVADAFADAILEDSGLAGGVVVVIGPDDADLAVALSKRGSFVVQCLCLDDPSLQATRRAIRQQAVYGPVSASLWSGPRLPYVENFAKCIIIDDFRILSDGTVSTREIERVVTPRGIVYAGTSNQAAGQQQQPEWARRLSAEISSAGFENVRTSGLADALWVRAAKPWPEDIDEWHHHTHDPNGNPVANDSRVGPPEHYQWQAGPTWFRSHDTDATIAAVVSANGRLFHIADKAPASVCGNHPLPDKWTLVARDAFSGALLWEVPLKRWGWREWKDTWFSFRPGNFPLGLDKRLVAIGDRVYFTLGYHAPVSQLDAKTGRVIQTYEQTEDAREILHIDGDLILTVDTGPRLKVMRLNAETGEVLWESDKRYDGIYGDYLRWGNNRGTINRPDLDPVLNPAANDRFVGILSGMDVICLDAQTGRQLWRNEGESETKTLWVGTMIVYDDVLLHASPQQLLAYDAHTGEKLWTRPKKWIQHLWFEWKDVFVIDDLVWTWSAEFNSGQYTMGKRTGRSHWPAFFNGYDLHTGEVKQQVPLGNIFKAHHHHRCYRNKATPRYIIASRRGAEFIDLETGVHDVNNWVRGACHYGMMPANGLLYAPTHPCVCYMPEKLKAFNALASTIPQQYQPKAEPPGPQLQRGPAFGRALGNAADADDWPAYRHDSMRTGSTPAEMPESLSQMWSIDIGGKLSPPIIADNKLFVSQIDSHHILAFDATTGNKLWDFAAAARIDSPPTYHDGMVLFGSADGWAYCLRASDGEIVWRFRGAPQDRRMGAYGQIESVWPIHGSILVHDGTAYLSAGRSSHLDGGIYLYALNATTGKQIHTNRLQGPARPYEELEQNAAAPLGWLTDIMKTDGDNIYMYHNSYSMTLQHQGRNVPGISPRGGFLDGSYFRRIPWNFTGGGTYGRLIVCDDQSVHYIRMWDSLHGLDPKNYFTPGKDGYRLFAQDRANNFEQRWSYRVPVRVRAMVAAPNVLYAAGPPDVIDPDDPLGAFEGRLGAKLMVVATGDGEKLQQYDLESPPVFNGMAAADGRLYIATRDGHLLCMGEG